MSHTKIPAVAIPFVLFWAVLYPASAHAENSVLSLLWSSTVSPDTFGKRSTTVRFGYDYEKSSGQKFEWRAGEDSPLVIYDPQQRKVVSEETLIGAWTYGGRNYKNPDAPRVPWSDAYEALATLDKNRDYSVSGRELQVVSLWFDRNRDGQAQGEEVVPASTVGLAEIALRGQPLLLPDGSKYYRQGFRKFKVTGEIITGSSITWSIGKLDKKPPVTATPSVILPTVPPVLVVPTIEPSPLPIPTETVTATPTPSATLTPTLTPSSIPTEVPASPVPTRIPLSSPEPEKDRSATPTAAAETTAVIKAKRERSIFNGFWRWVNDFDAQPDSGLMHLEVLEDGAVRGTSVSSPDQKADGDPVTTARVVPIVGQVTGEQGEQVSFKMLMPDRRQSTSCVASIVERNGKTFLKGSSVSQIVDADAVQREVRYEWLAVRSAEP